MQPLRSRGGSQTRPWISRADLRAFDAPPPGGRTWRVAHLSDLHAVGERYGFRIESGRAGPRGNTRLERLLARLEAIHAERPVDLVLITGDMTDAGRSGEWAELLATLGRQPAVREVRQAGDCKLSEALVNRPCQEGDAEQSQAAVGAVAGGR